MMEVSGIPPVIVGFLKSSGGQSSDVLKLFCTSWHFLEDLVILDPREIQIAGIIVDIEVVDLQSDPLAEFGLEQ